MIPALLITLLTPFQSLFRCPSWIKFQILLAGAILLTCKRTVTQILRVTGRSVDNRYALYHHVLSRAVWLPLRAAQKLLCRLLKLSNRWCLALMKRLNVAGEPKSKHEVSIVMPCVLHQATLSKPVDYVGLR